MKAGFLAALAFLAAPAFAQLPAQGELGAIKDSRYCGEPARYADGTIKRSSVITRAFAKVFPCPATLEPITSCKGWQIDHVIPLASGGCDSQQNMQWLPINIKTCALKACKDRWERVYHGIPRKAILP